MLMGAPTKDVDPRLANDGAGDIVGHVDDIAGRRVGHGHQQLCIFCIKKVLFSAVYCQHTD